MLDVVVVAMFAVLPLMAWSIYLVRYRRNYSLHRKVNLTLASTLLITVVLFEVDMRINGWRHLAMPSSLYGTWVFPILYTHLVFAILTVILWIMTVYTALREFPKKPRVEKPVRHLHKHFARFAAAGMLGTAMTGWAFYVAAFML